jgi:hypothetical protein
MPSEIYYFAGSHLKKCFAGTLKCWVVNAKQTACSLAAPVETCVHTYGAKSSKLLTIQSYICRPFGKQSPAPLNVPMV